MKAQTSLILHSSRRQTCWTLEMIHLQLLVLPPCLWQLVHQGVDLQLPLLGLLADLAWGLQEASPCLMMDSQDSDWTA
jgi:hypothetical protein